MLISFEGIDGCGKSTQIHLFKKYLEENNVSFKAFREPGGTIMSEKVRDLLLDSSSKINAVTELLLFSAARSQLIQEKVIPSLEKGELVILDRFFDSTLAYQGYGRKAADIEIIEKLNSLATHNIVPDLTFYLKISPQLAQNRTQSQSKDRLEKEGLDFFNLISNGYDEIAKNQKRVKVIDASKSPDEVFTSIKKIFERQRF